MRPLTRLTSPVLVILSAAAMLVGCPSGMLDDLIDPGGEIPEGTTAWAKRAGGFLPDRGSAVAPTQDGGCIVAGYFTGSATFGQDETNETTLNSSGFQDSFLARFDADGNLAWAKRAGGGGEDWATAVDVFAGGGFVVTGYFQNSAVFGDGEPNRTVLVSSGGRDVFVAKYNPDGKLAWARAEGDKGEDKGLAVAAFADGSCVVAGFYDGNPAFGNATQPALPTFGEGDVFIAKYNTGGAVLWSRWAAGQGADKAYGASALPDGSAIITGFFTDNAMFGSDEPNQIVLTAYGTDGETADNADMFLARYNPGGSLAWAVSAGGTGYDSGYGVSALPDGTCAVTGAFTSQAVWGQGEGAQTALTASGAEDVFVARYNTLGNLTWAARSGGPLDDQGFAVQALADGSCVVGGSFSGSATFASVSGASQVTRASKGDDDIFLSFYTSTGVLAWVNAAGGVQTDRCYGIAGSPDATFFGTGSFQGTATFPPAVPDEGEADGGETAKQDGDGEDVSLTSTGQSDIFVAGFAPPDAGSGEQGPESKGVGR